MEFFGLFEGCGNGEEMGRRFLKSVGICPKAVFYVRTMIIQVGPLLFLPWKNSLHNSWRNSGVKTRWNSWRNSSSKILDEILDPFLDKFDLKSEVDFLVELLEELLV